MRRLRGVSVILAALLTAGTIGGLAGCGNGLKKGKVQITYWAPVSNVNQDIVLDIVNTYNENNTDNVYVNMTPKATGYSKELSTVLAGTTPPDVVSIDDRYFKGYVNSGFLEPLDEYVAASDVDLNDIWASTVERFRYNGETGYSGGDNPLYAIPSDNNPTLIYYNSDMFEKQNINIISVAEEDLDAYNAANGTHYLPHGYYVYSASPADGLKFRSDGKYHVFNNRIPMNWEELVEISKLLTKGYNSSSDSQYGFMNEWWFSHGWSVGGDCLEWSEEQDQYIFALGDETSNYLVTGSETITVDGTSYAEGDLLTYEDKHYVADVAAGTKTDAEVTAWLEGNVLYKMPSIKDAFTEFCCLSQQKDKTVSSKSTQYCEGVGYGVSPSPTTLAQKGKVLYFTSGDVAMLCESAVTSYTIGRALNGKADWDVAPLYQYREYNEDGTLKTVNGTEIKGKKSAHNATNGYAIPKNSKRKDAAWSFIRYLLSEEVQNKIAVINMGVPAIKKIANSETYLTSTQNYAPKNKWVFVEAAEYATVGDWSYIEDGEWITGWSEILNSKVRDGNMTLEQFFADPTVLATNDILKTKKAKKFNG